MPGVTGEARPLEGSGLEADSSMVQGAHAKEAGTRRKSPTCMRGAEMRRLSNASPQRVVRARSHSRGLRSSVRLQRTPDTSSDLAGVDGSYEVSAFGRCEQPG